MAGLIVGDPFFDLLAGNVARRRQRTTSAMQPHGEKKQDFLLLLGRQRIGSLFDFGERAHGGTGCTFADGTSTFCAANASALAEFASGM